MRSITLLGILCVALSAAPVSAGVWDFTPPNITPPTIDWPTVPSLPDLPAYTPPTYTPPTIDPPAVPSIDDMKARVEELKQKVAEKYGNLPTPPSCDDWPSFPSLGDWPTPPSLGDWPAYDCPKLDEVKAKLDELKQDLAEKYENLPKPPSYDDWPKWPDHPELPSYPTFDEIKAKYEALKENHPTPPVIDPPELPTADEIKAKYEALKQEVEEKHQELAAKHDEAVQEHKDWVQSVADSVHDSDPFEFYDGLYDLTDGQYTGSSSYLLTGGTLKGTGLVDALFEQWGGVFAPGHSPGLVVFTDGYTLGGGELQIEIQSDGGVPGVDFDFFDITGTAVLDSTVKLILLEGFEPEDQATFDVMTADNFVFGANFLLDQSELALWGGHFDLSVIAGGNGDILRLTALAGPLTSNPEPSTIVMLLTTALCLAGYSWRRRRAARR